MNVETKHFVRWFLISDDPEIVKYRGGFNLDAPDTASRLQLLATNLFLNMMGDEAADMPAIGEWDENDYRYWRPDTRSAELFAPMLDSVINRIDYEAATLEVVNCLRHQRAIAYTLN